MTRLIVTADDLGLHRGMTEGAIRAHREGIVTACSLSANGLEIEHAAEEVGAEASLDAGIHFTLVEERPVLPADRVRTLVGRDGRFPRSYASFAARYLSGRIDLDQVESELRAQVERLVSLGVRPIHANGHQHLHVLPGVFERVLSVCRELGIRYVRIPNDAGGSGPAVRGLSVAILGSLARRAARAAASTDFVCNDRAIGIVNAGHLGEQQISFLLEAASGVTELVTHPGVGASISSRYSWGYEWDRETAALCSSAVRNAIERRGITLTSIRDLLAEAG